MVDNLPALHNITIDEQHFDIQVGFPIGFIRVIHIKSYLFINAIFGLGWKILHL